MDKRISVFAEWDPEADVYVAASDDVPGLVTEGADQDELRRNLKILIPELLELNGELMRGGEKIDSLCVTLHLKQESRLPVHA